MAWGRIGDINHYHHVRSSKLPVRYVAYKNTAYWRKWPLVPSIKLIEIIQHGDGKNLCKITGSPICSGQLYRQIEKHFSETEYKSIGCDGHIYYEFTWDANIAAKFIKLFLNMNAFFERTEFTQEIIKEMEVMSSICDDPFFKNNPFSSKMIAHCIPEKKNIRVNIFQPYSNPSKAGQTNVLGVLAQFEKGKIEESKVVPLVIDCLAEGDNIDQTTETGKDLGRITLTDKSLNKKLLNQLIEIYLFYGLNVCQTKNGEDYCLVEFAIILNLDSTLQVILAAIPKIEKPLKLEMQNDSVEKLGSQIKSKFHFKNGTRIFSVIKHVNEITPKEKADLFRLYFECFKDPKEDASYEAKIFEEEFAPSKNKPKLVDLLFADEDGSPEMIGFALTTAKRINNELKSIPLYVGMTAQYRNLRFPPLLKSRQGMSLQPYTKERIGIAYSAMHVDIYGQDLGEHFPKHQTNALRQSARNYVYDTHEVVEYVQKDLTCYFKENNPFIVTSPSFTRPMDDIRQRMFYGRFQAYERDLPGFPNNVEKSLELVTSDPRITPILYPANLVNVFALQATLWKNFNVLSHCLQLGPLLCCLLESIECNFNSKPCVSLLNYSIWSPPDTAPHFTSEYKATSTLRSKL